MTIQGQAIGAAAAANPVLPIEIAFLRNHGVGADLLRRAAEAARRSGCIRRRSAAQARPRRRSFLLPGACDRDRAALSQERRAGRPRSAVSLQPAPRPRTSGAVTKRRQPFRARAGRPASRLAPQSRPGFRRRDFGHDAIGAARRDFREHGAAIAAAAANGLADADPSRSYRDGCTPAQKLCGPALGCVLLAGAVADLGLTLSALVIVSGIVFLGMVTMRLGAVREHISTRPARRIAQPPDDALPIYTIIVPLRRERRVLARLIAAMAALDYPETKKDVKLVIEADDREMADALAPDRASPAHRSHRGAAGRARAPSPGRSTSRCPSRAASS